jgi:hypothetical protein
LKRTGRQSDNIEDIRDPSANAKYQAVQQQRNKAMAGDRLISDEAIAYQKGGTPADRVANIVRNPGKANKSRATGQGRVAKDPATDTLDKTSRANYDEVPFFKHKEVPNVYKEEK